MKTAEDIVYDKNKDMICISHTETIHKALQLMVANKIGALLVKKKRKNCWYMDGARPHVWKYYAGV